MVVAARRLRTRPELGHHPRKLPRRLAHRALAFLAGRQRRLSQHPGIAVGGGPGGDVARPVAEQIGEIEVRSVAVIGNLAIGDQLRAHVVPGQMQVDRRLQLARVSYAAGKAAFAPARQEVRVDRQQLPPRTGRALGVGLQVDPARGQVEVRRVGAVAVEEHDLLEAVVGQAGADVDHALDEVLPVDVGGAGKVHHVGGVAVHERRHDQHLIGYPPRGRRGDAARADHVDVERQMRAVLLGRPDRADHHPLLLHRFIDFRPGEFLVAPRLRSRHQVPPCARSILAHVSRRPMVRLKTARPGAASRASRQK